MLSSPDSRLALVGVLAAACAPQPEEFLRYWDSTWLRRNHACDLTVEPLATGEDAERLVGLDAEMVFAAGTRFVEVAWESGAIPREAAPWRLVVASPWNDVRAVRTLVPSACPSGLVLEAHTVATLEFSSGRGEGDWWTAANEVEPSRQFWSWSARLPVEAAPDSLRGAIAQGHDPAARDARLWILLTRYDDQGYIQVELESELEVRRGHWAWASQSLASGTFIVVDEG